ncbi:uncharacterized protein TNCV_3157321 [Trichonephila clavipes]|nr:uncharacterized protein TNCV_3157321 [Trichonephila clavipes]
MYCTCSELDVVISSMSKLPYLDAFDQCQIVDARCIKVGSFPNLAHGNPKNEIARNKAATLHFMVLLGSLTIWNTYSDNEHFQERFFCLDNEHIFGGDQGGTPKIKDGILTTVRDLELEVNEDDIEELIMGH